ncbi:FkbM family methyltransferase [Sulfitobacter sp. D35]|uniref:FkbM family methyltransferase n=1 Tax=Sulfitobacter sp. D35 TaxID=3083252 RepID=UPI00296F50C9|nr:FkbM family methyltransferase [Sulfitobacter sp. D35]MDW4497490.1 FkbM family methyltransferase [Sulfitobacter sp. D35]
MTEADPISAPSIAAECHGVRVPASPFLTPGRIARIDAGRYERHEIAGALDIVRSDDRVLELGAGLGVVGGVVARRCAPEAILSYEANPDLMPHARALHRLNGHDQVELRNAVVLSGPDRPDTVAFHLRSSFLGASLAEPRGPSRRIEVATASFEGVRRAFRPSILIMDIEGGELDLLRHADLAGVRGVVVEFHPGVYGADGMRECKDILRRAGFRRRAAVSTRRVWCCTRAVEVDTADAPPDPDGGWSCSLRMLRDATVVPPLAPGFVQPAGVLYADGRHCGHAALWRNHRPLTMAPDMPATPSATLDGRWLWGGVLWSNFAHFVAESTSRLWALDAPEADGLDGILFIPKRPRVGAQLTGFHRDWIALMGSELPLKVATEPVRVAKLLVPGQGFGLGRIVAGTDVFRRAMRHRFAADVAPDGPERLYISRSRLGPGRGGLLGEAELETCLAREGYEIFHPQAHDLCTQIARYKAARRIVACDGSALHVCAMVATERQRIAILQRRPSGATDQIAAHLTHFSGRSPLVIDALEQLWRRGGSTRNRLAIGQPDLPAVRQALIDSGFVSRDVPAWPPVSRDAIAELIAKGFVPDAG